MKKSVLCFICLSTESWFKGCQTKVVLVVICIQFQPSCHTDMLCPLRLKWLLNWWTKLSGPRVMWRRPATWPSAGVGGGMPNSGSHSPIKHIIWWVKVCFLFGCVCGASHPPLSECFKWDAVSWCKSSIVGKWILNIFFLGSPHVMQAEGYMQTIGKPNKLRTCWSRSHCQWRKARLGWASLVCH